MRSFDCVNKNFPWWMSRLLFRWRTQRIVITNVNRRTCESLKLWTQMALLLGLGSIEACLNQRLCLIPMATWVFVIEDTSSLIKLECIWLQINAIKLLKATFAVAMVTICYMSEPTDLAWATMNIDNSTWPDFKQDYPLDLSISLRGGKENNYDSLSSGERKGKSSRPNPHGLLVVRTCSLWSLIIGYRCINPWKRVS